MDPLSALIGGGLALGGGLLSSQSTAGINQQNIANQQAMASGAYLPGLVSNAQKAGINPLAALGIHTPSAGMAVPTDPGAGLRGAAGFAAQTSLHQLNMQQYDEERARAGIEALNSQIKNDTIQAAVRLEALRRLERNPTLIPGDFREPVQESASGIPQANWLGGVLQRNWNTFDLRSIFGGPQGPPYVRRDF